MTEMNEQEKACESKVDSSLLSRECKKELWSSPEWLRFQESSKSFISNENEGVYGDEDYHRKVLGDLFEMIVPVVTLKHRSGNIKTKKSRQTILQLFTESSSEGHVKLLSHFSFLRLLEQEAESDSYTTIRRIQWQVRLRLALWQHLGTRAFVTAWMHHVLSELPPKRRRRAKKEGDSPDLGWKLCCEDFTSLLSLGLMKLHCDRQQQGGKVEQFLSSCGLGEVKGTPEWKSRLVKHVWTFFDVNDEPRPKKPLSKKSKQQPSAVLPPLPVPEEESVKSRSSVTTTSTNKENGQGYFGKRVTLTAPAKKSNSLLGKSGRTRFNGSHFNTNLTNVSALFRSVPIEKKAPIGQKDALKNSKLTGQKRLALGKAPRALAPKLTESPPPMKVRTTSTQVRVDETPAIKRKRSRVVCETPDGVRRSRPRTLPL